MWPLDIGPRTFTSQMPFFITKKTVEDKIVHTTVLKVLQKYYNTFRIEYC